MGSKSSICIAIIFLMLFSGCTLWRQATTPATWGMSLPDMWEYEKQQRNLQHPTIKVICAKTGRPLTNLEINVIPRPAIYPLGIPKNRTYQTDGEGIAVLKELPTGPDSMISLSGNTAIVSNLIELGEISFDEMRIEHVEH